MAISLRPEETLPEFQTFEGIAVFLQCHWHEGHSEQGREISNPKITVSPCSEKLTSQT